MTLIQRAVPYPHWEFTAPWGDRLLVVPERGGLVTGWCCGGVERLYFDAERFADPALSVRGGIPVLFPVCGNLPDGRLQLPQGMFAMPQHGFARDLPWALEALEDGSGIRLQLQDSDATRAVYPFPFSLRLEYRLEPEALAIRAVIVHERARHGGSAAEPEPEPWPMPFALGLHPYLGVEDLAAAGLEGLPPQCFDHLSAAEGPTVVQLQRLPEGVDLRVEIAAGQATTPRLIGAAKGGAVPGGAVALELQTPFDHVVVWTDPPRPMVCLEPWTARRGVLGLELAPGEHQELSCRYSVRAA
ncbi:MAG: galactose mutarotase [Vulcanococcus sp.]